MSERALRRLTDMQDAITQISNLLEGKSYEDLLKDRVTRAAFERFLEVLSEASRHVPEDWKSEQPHVRWRQLADLGNHLRHAYQKTDPELLWAMYEVELPPLAAAVEAIISARAPGP
jgi:uncharacterized protein with HEPN domain